MLSAEEASEATFARAIGGYRRDEVEALRSRVMSALVESDRGRLEGLAVGALELDGASFSTALRGYRRDDVDQFVARAGQALADRGITAGSGRRRVTAVELGQVRFGWEFDGYDPRAVRRFLTRVAAALDTHHRGGVTWLTREEVEGTHLPLRFLGYSCLEVEAVCERISSTLSFYEARGRVTFVPRADGSSVAAK